MLWEKHVLKRCVAHLGWRSRLPLSRRRRRRSQRAAARSGPAQAPPEALARSQPAAPASVLTHACSVMHLLSDAAARKVSQVSGLLLCFAAIRCSVMTCEP